MRISKNNSVEFFFTSLPIALSWIFYFGICAAVIYSLYFGVEPYDEALYIAMPYHLVLGGKTFIDELHPAQTAGLFLYPAVKIFYGLQGSTDSIILFARYLYTAITIAFSLAFYFLLRPIVAKPALIILITLGIIFVPFNIHSLSYNNFSMLCFTLSVVLHLYAIVEKKSSIILFFSALFLMFSAIAYPTFVSVVPLVMGIFWLYPPRNYKLQAIGAYVVGLLVGSVWFLYLFLRMGFTQMQRFAEYLFGLKSVGSGVGGTEKIFGMAKQLLFSLPHFAWCGVLFVVALGILWLEKKYPQGQSHQIWRWTRGLLVLGILGTVLWLIRTADAMLYIRYLALTAPIFFLLALNQPSSAKLHGLFYVVCIPAYIAGLVTAWSSSNGIYNATIGFFPAALAALIYVYFVLQKTAALFKWPAVVTNFISMLVLAAVIYPLYVSNHVKNYADADNPQLTTRVPSGIYKGIYTTPAKSNFYEQMELDLKTVRAQAKTILVFDEFPAGYLLTDLLPATNTLWTYSAHRCPTCSRQATVDYIKRNVKPDLVVQMRNVAENPNPTAYDYYYPPDDPITALLAGYRLILERPHYRIYLRLF